MLNLREFYHFHPVTVIGAVCLSFTSMIKLCTASAWMLLICTGYIQVHFGHKQYILTACTQELINLQLIKFWPSHTPRKEVCGWAKIFGSALLQPARNVWLRLSECFFHVFQWMLVIILYVVCQWRRQWHVKSATLRTMTPDLHLVWTLPTSQWAFPHVSARSGRSQCQCPALRHVSVCLALSGGFMTTVN